MNVILHAISTLLLFTLLLRITGARWPSAFVAFVFALHPLHIESVAWVAERKDVLSTLFWMLTLLAYASYVERKQPWRYMVAVLMFCCGLMAKPMLVTVPLTLILLDVWPLRRWNLIEKAPFFALSAISAAITFMVQRGGGAVATFDQVPFVPRLENAIVSCAVYVVKFFWPSNLAVFYPFPATIPLWQPLAAGAALIAVTAAVLKMRADRPYLAVGWFWYLITIAPVIGIIQIGLHSRADRYTYVPMIGISLMLAWGLRDWGGRAAVAAAVAVCAAWSAVTWIDVPYWRDSLTLFQRAIDVTSGNYVAYNNRGVALKDSGRTSEAIATFQDALRIHPGYGDAENNLGDALLAEGRIDEAAPHIQEALRLRPRSAAPHVNYGSLLNKRGRFDEAAAQYREALALEPANAAAHCGLGVTLTEKGLSADALDQLTAAIRLDPDYVDAHYNLGRLYGLVGRSTDAAAEFAETIRLDPGNAEAHYNLGTALASQNQLARALEEFRTAVRLKPDYLNARFNLGASLASLGRYDEAIPEFKEVLRLKPDFPEARRNLEECLKLLGRR